MHFKLFIGNKIENKTINFSSIQGGCKFFIYLYIKLLNFNSDIKLFYIFFHKSPDKYIKKLFIQI